MYWCAHKTATQSAEGDRKTGIKPFRALNEYEKESEDDENGRISPLHKDTRPELYSDYEPPPTTQEPQEDQDEITEVDVLQGESIYMGKPEADLPDYETEETGYEPRDYYEQESYYGQEYGEDSKEDVDSVESPQDREVYMKLSRNQWRNRQRRRSKKIKREQANTPVKERLDANHPNMRRLRQGNKANRNTHSPSTETPSEEEQDDAHDTKVPKTRARSQRK